jgi:hypothetical protein
MNEEYVVLSKLRTQGWLVGISLPTYLMMNRPSCLLLLIRISQLAGIRASENLAAGSLRDKINRSVYAT